jgi:hypothetical protein
VSSVASKSTQSSPSERRAAAFPERVPRPTKARIRRRTPQALTPVHVRARDVRLEPGVRAHLDRRMARQFGKFALHIERATVRFQDLNGPRGGKDQRCELKLVLSGLPSVVVQKRAATQRAAFDSAAAAAQQTLSRRLARAGVAAPRAQLAELRAAGRVSAVQPVNGGGTARRNFKQNLAGLTAALEDAEQPRPSRKSTRGSTNRALRDNKLRRRAVRRTTSPKARARRSRAKRGAP